MSGPEPIAAVAPPVFVAPAEPVAAPAEPVVALAEPVVAPPLLVVLDPVELKALLDGSEWPHVRAAMDKMKSTRDCNRSKTMEPTPGSGGSTEPQLGAGK
jgi:hypothetical protein